jgi:hypothetical protein
MRKEKALKGRNRLLITRKTYAALSGLIPKPMLPGACAPGFAIPRFQRCDLWCVSSFETASGEPTPYGIGINP